MSVPMALFDFIPVILFFLSSLIIMRGIYHMASKGAFALASGGMIVIFIAGTLKALYKLLFALDICEYTVLNDAFFPMQTTGFMMAALGLCSMLIFRQKENAAFAAVPFTSKMPFVALLIVGTAGFSISLCILAFKMKKRLAGILLIVYLVAMLGMGYLSSRDFSDPKMNWIGEGVNAFGQLLLLFSVRSLDKAGLEKFEI